MAKNPKIVVQTPKPGMYTFAAKNGTVKGTFIFDSAWAQRQTGKFDAAQQFVDTETLRRNAPYVPMDTGMLIASGRYGTVIGRGEVQYVAPYARATYYTHKNYKGAPMRGAYHFERMKADHKEAILRGAGKIAGGK